MRDGLDSSLRSARTLFARRLNILFSNSYPPQSSGEVAAKIRESGTPITVSIISELRSGHGRIPPPKTVKALADFFGVGTDYFFDENKAVDSGAGSETTRPPSTGDAEDPTAWRFADYQPTDVSLAAGRHRAPEPHSVTPPQSAELLTSSQPDVFAERLNLLFESTTGPGGRPHSSTEVATSLQEDGLAVSADAIEKLRRGQGGDPQPQMVEALAYFFNVDTDYFTAAGQLTAAETTQERRDSESHEPTTFSEEPADPVTTTKAHPIQILPIGTGELGQIIVGLSEAAARSITTSPPDYELAERLLSLLGAVGAILTLPAARPTISRPLLRQIVREWGRAGGTGPRSRRLLDRLSVLLNED